MADVAKTRQSLFSELSEILEIPMYSEFIPLKPDGTPQTVPCGLLSLESVDFGDRVQEQFRFTRQTENWKAAILSPTLAEADLLTQKIIGFDGSFEADLKYYLICDNINYTNDENNLYCLNVNFRTVSREL